MNEDKDQIAIEREFEILTHSSHRLRTIVMRLLRRNSQLEERVSNLTDQLSTLSKPVSPAPKNSRKMLSKSQLLDRWSVSNSTYYQWRNQHPEFPKPAFAGSPVRFWIHEIEQYEKTRAHPDRT